MMKINAEGRRIKSKRNLILGCYLALSSLILLTLTILTRQIAEHDFIEGGGDFSRDLKILHLLAKSVGMTMEIGLLLVIVFIFIAKKKKQVIFGLAISLAGYLCYFLRYILIIFSLNTVKVNHFITLSLVIIFVGGCFVIKENLDFVKKEKLKLDDRKIKKRNDIKYIVNLIAIVIVSYYSIFVSLSVLLFELFTLSIFGTAVSFIYGIITLYMLDGAIKIGIVLTIITTFICFCQSEKNKQVIIAQLISLVSYSVTLLWWKNGEVINASFGLLIIAISAIYLIVTFVRKSKLGVVSKIEENEE